MRGLMQNKRKRAAAVALTAAAVQLLVPMPAFAERSPEFARTAEEWARLRDNVLEYDEIEDLITEYNVTVQNNYADWKKTYAGKSASDLTQDAWSKINSSYAEDSVAGDMQAKMGEIEMQRTIDEAGDGTTMRWENEKTEKLLAAEAQSAMNTYYQLQDQIASAQRSRQLTEAMLGITQRQQGAGMTTYAEVLTAQQSLQNMDAQIIDLQNQMESTRQKLIVMLGWTQNGLPEIQPMPELDLNRIAAMNPQTDAEKACENDYTLKIDQRKLDNSYTESGKAMHTANISNDRQQIAVALNAAYQAVLQAKSAYDQAILDLDIANHSHATAQARQSVGMGTAMETLQAETAAVNAQSAKDIAGLKLFQAMETYDWIVKGVRS